MHTAQLTTVAQGCHSAIATVYVEKKWQITSELPPWPFSVFPIVLHESNGLHMQTVCVGFIYISLTLPLGRGFISLSFLSLPQMG